MRSEINRAHLQLESREGGRHFPETDVARPARDQLAGERGREAHLRMKYDFAVSFIALHRCPGLRPVANLFRQSMFPSV